jgi:hypothetical protein
MVPFDRISIGNGKVNFVGKNFSGQVVLVNLTSGQISLVKLTNGELARESSRSKICKRQRTAAAHTRRSKWAPR